jgi:hypothetical protein
MNGEIICIELKIILKNPHMWSGINEARWIKENILKNPHVEFWT